MIKNDRQLGKPLGLFQNTKDNIEALTGLTGGEIAYATDTGEDGVYDAVSAGWVWGRGTLLASSSNDIFRCNNPGGASSFIGIIATLPGGATLTYTITSGNNAVLKPASTGHLAKLRLYNTTRNTYALISDATTATNTIILTNSVPIDWQVGDTISIASQTVVGEFAWTDFEITNEIINASGLFIEFTIVPDVAGTSLRIHPFETYSASKTIGVSGQVASIPMRGTLLVKIINNIFSVSWSGSPSAVLGRVVGVL